MALRQEGSEEEARAFVRLAVVSFSRTIGNKDKDGDETFDVAASSACAAACGANGCEDDDDDDEERGAEPEPKAHRPDQLAAFFASSWTRFVRKDWIWT